MSLTWKLVLGFLFALVLQVAQMLTSGFFTAQMRDASEQVSDALTACLAVQAALEATRELVVRVEQGRADEQTFDAAVARVFFDEVESQSSGFARMLDSVDEREFGLLRGNLVRLERTVHELGQGPALVGEARRDALEFLADDLGQLEQSLQRSQVRLRHAGRDGIERERAVHDLPAQASLVITLAGVVLMAAFVLWYSRQLVVPIQRAWGELERRVQERTAELAAARDAADAANQTKTAFLANVSHELRTPMTAILGFADLMLDGVSGDAGSLQHEAVATIRRNAESMVAIVNDLLDMSKLEAGKLAIECLPCSPLAVVEEVTALLRVKAEARRVRLQTVVPAPVPTTIRTDPLRLRQILVNLVDNAIKFSSGGDVTIVVSCTDGESPQLRCEVVDQGMGMPASVLARLFQAFEQADASTTRRHGGTGLGLAISRQLARLLGGDLVAASAVGHGSRFTVTVAMGVDVAPPAAPNVAPAPTSSQAASRPLTGARVLLVEDGPDNQRLLRHLLERAGCSMEIAANGKECVDRLASAGASFDVVLMDMQLPVRDGNTATRLLRQRGCDLPIVSLTANAMQADREACLSAGSDAFLSKPIDRKLLLATIADWRGRRSGRAAAPPAG